MQIKAFAMSTLAAAVLFGCASQQSTTDMSAESKPTVIDKAKDMMAAAMPAKKPAKAKPMLMTGASAAMLANTCAGCHGTMGASNGPATPTIAGLEEEYFVEVMQGYKSGDRSGTIMGRIAKGYSDAEIASMANFYGKMNFPARTQTTVGPLAVAGQKLHEDYCEKCHEDEGRNPEDIVLAGQTMAYVHWTMDDFASGKSKIGEKKMAKAMKKMLDKHGEKSLLELTHFYGSRK